MNYHTPQCFLIVSLLITTLSWADESRYWQCTASDNANQQWVLKSVYEPRARSKTSEACKKQSQYPATCKTDCEEFNHGISTRPAWQCTALDQNAKSWMSQPYAVYDDAAIAAKIRCKEHSAVPDTCYLNIATCKNLNKWP